MNGNGMKFVMLVVALISIATAAVAAETVLRLEHNPFKRPHYLNTAGHSSAQRMSGNAKLDLRATLSDGQSSLVNVGGRFYAIGEEIDGYRLLSVGEGKAVFVKDGNRLTITVSEETAVD